MKLTSIALMCALVISFNSLSISREELRAALEQETAQKLRKATAKFAYTCAKISKKENRIARDYTHNLIKRAILACVAYIGAITVMGAIVPYIIADTIENPVTKSSLVDLCAALSAAYHAYTSSDNIKKNFFAQSHLACKPANIVEKIGYAAIAGTTAGTCAGMIVRHSSGNIKKTASFLITSISNLSCAWSLDKYLIITYLKPIKDAMDEAIECERMKIKLREQTVTQLQEQLAVLRGTNK